MSYSPSAHHGAAVSGTWPQSIVGGEQSLPLVCETSSVAVRKRQLACCCRHRSSSCVVCPPMEANSSLKAGSPARSSCFARCWKLSYVCRRQVVPASPAKRCERPQQPAVTLDRDCQHSCGREEETPPGSMDAVMLVLLLLRTAVSAMLPGLAPLSSTACCGAGRSGDCNMFCQIVQGSKRHGLGIDSNTA